MWKNLERFLRDDEAPTAVEYALLAAFIAVVVVVAVVVYGQRTSNTYKSVADHMPT